MGLVGDARERPCQNIMLTIMWAHNHSPENPSGVLRGQCRLRLRARMGRAEARRLEAERRAFRLLPKRLV